MLKICYMYFVEFLMDFSTGPIKERGFHSTLCVEGLSPRVLLLLSVRIDLDFISLLEEYSLQILFNYPSRYINWCGHKPERR